MSKHTVLFELGCEELPPKSLKKLRDALKAETEKGLKDAGLAFDAIEAYAAPRRLALKIVNVDAAQVDTQKRFDGPAVQAAYDAEGKPTKALEGFMRGQGITVDQVSTFQAGKVEKVCYLKDVKGQSLDVLLPQILQNALDNLPIAKRMRSAASRTEFVRPVKWVVLLKDNDVVDATIQDHKAGNVTYGHRFHAPEAITLTHADEYLAKLKTAYVVASFEERQAIIDGQVKALADEVNAIAIVPADLRDEVTALVEWPVALRASFEERFLAVPQEALITTMQDNQKYFCLLDTNGKLLPRFITVANIESKDPAQIVSGNEKVVRPRLTDAEFFFKQDKKQPLERFNDRLKNVVFQAQLGTVFDKAERVSRLAGLIAERTGGDKARAMRAGLLSKADLATEMVGEFPEMQGIAGYYYALNEGEPEDVALALNEQYMPRGAGGELPSTLTGAAVAVADKLDTLVGIFGIGMLPTGSKDPYALRRAALGVLRILIEKQLDLNLVEAVNFAIGQFGTQVKSAGLADQVLEFIFDRLRARYEDEGVDVAAYLSVRAVQPGSALDFDQRVQAVQAFRTLPEAEALAAANKRVSNLLAKFEAKLPEAVEPRWFDNATEFSLYSALQQAEQAVQPLAAARQYREALERLAHLRGPVDAFFEAVLVNAEDASVRANRYALLARLRGLFLGVADISALG